MIKVTLLGTGNPVPDPNRGGSATLVQAGSSYFLFDAGRGVLQRLLAAGVMPNMLSAVLLTHLHSDHITDLNDVVTTRWVMSPVPNITPIWGPPRTQEVVDGMMAMLQPDVEYRIAHHEDLTWAPNVQVTELRSGAVLEADGVKITAEATDHKPVEPTVGYRIEHEGSVVVIGGDTVPCAGLDALCADADIYVQTVLRDDLVSMIPMQRFQDTIDYHSSVVQAAETATRNRVKTLVLTHMVPTPAPGAASEWIAIAEPHFTGNIIFGEDLTVIEA
jgi:ribonuclease Z